MEITEESKNQVVNEFSTRFSELTKACLAMEKEYNFTTCFETCDKFERAFDLLIRVIRSRNECLEDLLSEDRVRSLINVFNEFEKIRSNLSSRKTSDVLEKLMVGSVPIFVITEKNRIRKNPLS